MTHRYAAYYVLWQRYRDVFAYFWRERARLDGRLLTEHEAEFQPAALAIQEKPLSPTIRLTARILMLLILILLLWSVFGKIDIVVNAKGKVIPQAYTKAVSAIEVSAVRALHVVEGQSVHAGDSLVELDSSSAQAEHDKATGNLNLARLQIARSQALLMAIEQRHKPQLQRVGGTPDELWHDAQQHAQAQYDDYIAKLARFDANIVRYSSQLLLATQRSDDYKALLVNHDVTEHAWMEKQQAYLELKGLLTDMQRQRQILISDTCKEARDAMVEAIRLASESAQDAKRSADHAKLLTLRAPVDGTVQQLMLHTVGGVVPAAQSLMLIVPKDNQVEIEARMENRDIGFVQEGQAAAVKIDTFEYTKYGTIPAHVAHVSRDAVEDEKKNLLYVVKIQVDRSNIVVDGKDLPLSAGMSANVEIKTGERRIIEYILSPLLHHQRETLRER
ncbi:HlyD family type I secretion periplasmic adaptor subunit [Undibacterium sp. TJN25]|uniref:HlyD family type I secretion periplasmic adaptor subunit n=1 Tax=Undibacterium sp. TJN25 TaxID=3413056 RepID=UPI003BF0B790